MDLTTAQRYWDGHARTDPMWAILTDPAKHGGKWETEEFFATGVAEIACVMQKLNLWGVPVSRKRALDFGCGIGRATQALADYFEKVCGLDISPGMLEAAGRHNRKGGRCEFVWNPDPDLRCFENASFDLIYSRLTLQHIRPAQVRVYLKEFLRLLASGGLLYFQYPSRAICPYSGLLAKTRFRLARIQSLLQSPPHLYMNSMRRSRVVALLERNGGKIVEIEENQDAGAEYISYAYAVTN